MYTVYQTTNLVNDKIYVGVHKTENAHDSYMGSGPLILKAIDKYGIDNFKKDILFIFETKDDAYAKESELVDSQFISRSDTYNLTLGGYGSWAHIDSSGENNPMKNPESRAKLSAAIKATRSKNPEFYNEVSAKNWSVASANKIGKKHSDTTKERQRQGMLKFYETNVSVLKGVKKSDSHRAAMSKGWTGSHRAAKSESMKAKIKENPNIVKTNLGKKFSDETKRRMSEAAKLRHSKPKPIVTCPHCNKTGSSVAMKRWHFDKCKHNVGI